MAAPAATPQPSRSRELHDAGSRELTLSVRRRRTACGVQLLEAGQPYRAPVRAGSYIAAATVLAGLRELRVAVGTRRLGRLRFNLARL